VFLGKSHFCTYMPYTSMSYSVCVVLYSMSSIATHLADHSQSSAVSNWHWTSCQLC